MLYYFDDTKVLQDSFKKNYTFHLFISGQKNFELYAPDFCPPPLMFYRDSRRALLIASTFELAEQERLLLFLATPYCTNLEAENYCLELFRFFFARLNEAQAKDKNGAITDKMLFEALYKGQKFTPEAFNEVTAEAFRLIKKFIAFEMTVTQWNERDELTCLLLYYKKKGLAEKFGDMRESLAKKQKERETWIGEDYWWNYLVEKADVEFSSLYNRKKDDLNLLNAIHTLNEFFLVESLILASTLYTQNRLTPLAFQSLNELLPYDPNDKNLDWFFTKPLGKLFIMSLRFMGANIGSFEHQYEDYEFLLLQEEGHLNEKLYNNFERIGINYLATLCNAGKKEYREPIFKALQRRVESGRIYVEGKITADEMQNIVLIGLRVKAFDWVYQFLTTHQHKIMGTESPQVLYEFNLAVYYFYIKEFQKTLDILKRLSLQTKSSETQYKASSKILEIMVFYELGEKDLDSTLEAANQHFFRMKQSVGQKKLLPKSTNAEVDGSNDVIPRKKGRKKNSEKAAVVPINEAERRKNEALLARVSNYVNFINMMKQVTHPDTSHSYERVQKLLEKVKGNLVIAEHDWLTEKLQTMLEKLDGTKRKNK